MKLKIVLLRKLKSRTQKCGQCGTLVFIVELRMHFNTTTERYTLAQVLDSVPNTKQMYYLGMDSQ
jgi:hypothetical protein